MSKIHIGKKGGRYGVWVAAPGYDASSEGGKMILDSDRDALFLHHREEFTVNGFDTGSSSDLRYDYNGTEFYFPALTYIPVIMLMWRWAGGDSIDRRLYFPPSYLIDKSTPIGTREEAFPLLYFNDHVEIAGAGSTFHGLSWASQMKFTLYVYKNKLRDL